ncbi:glycosyltransferase [Rhizobium leguminosarum bv. trifolii WSM2297]|uniref:Glycosyltransferase n=1 Tax=Rhizobium leguminosarum bv. trifolii WSM2297 TaxID=754762 RepID=J0WAC9_RHILT|nr:glycosyltransferase family 4 protein [Rhizobium leguminosarum]EJC82691.1 glycosyltransferase [Rhizobium leguminosarum bv. trifolii WSM2297]
MRILFVSQYFWPEDFRANDIVLGLKERGHEVVVVTGLPNYPGGKLLPTYSLFRGPYREEWNGIEIIRSPLLPRGQSDGIKLTLNYISFALFCSMIMLFRRRKADIVFCWMVSPITQVLPAIVAKKLLSVPLVLWVMDLWPDSLFASGRVSNRYLIALVGSFTRWIYRRCDIILGQSRRFIGHIKKVGKFSHDRVYYMPQWEPPVLPADLVAISLPPLPEGFRIVFTGNVGFSQDFGTIVEAARRLSARSDIHWIVVGEGDALQWVRERVAEAGLQANFHLLGRYPFGAMPEFYHNADVLLATLRRVEIFSMTIPTKIQSYLSSGRPMITAIDGEVAEIVSESGAGFAVPAGDAESLAGAVLKMASLSKRERAEMGERGQHYFRKNFGRDELLDRLTTLLKEVAESGSRS